jgi:Flp pilus assembly pilin Flp
LSFYLSGVKDAFRKSLAQFRHLVVEYGVIALLVHYAIFAVVIIGFWAAIRSGWQPSGTTGSVGSWTAAYVATKITQPLRIVATIAITPFIARMYERVTGKKRATVIAPRGD